MSRTWDWLLYVIILGIGAISLSVIFAVNRDLALTQSVFWVFGLSLLYVVSHINYRDFLDLAKPFFGLSVILLIVLLIVGDPVRGSTRWFDFGFFRVQPSEIAKAASIFLLATIYAAKNAKNIRNLVTGFLLVSIPAFLVFIEPDIGNSISFFAIWFGIAFASGMRLKHVALLFLCVGIFSFLAYEFLAPYQRERLVSFIDPLKDPLGTGYNIIQAKIAIGSGGFFGKGLSQGSQSQLNFLPEAESDFIFATIAEQLGFVGASLLVALFLALIARCLSVTKKAGKLEQLVIIGIVSFLLLQFVVNVGMNLGLMPVTGITFPLVSYGGSSLITTLFLIGIIFSIKRFSLH